MIEQSRGAALRAEGAAAEHSELREFAADRLVRFLNTSKLELPGGVSFQEVLRNKESIKAFVLSLSADNYIRLLTGINAMVRGKSGHETWEMDGEGVLMGDQDIFPMQADKSALLARSLEAAKQMNAEGRSTEDIALLLSVSVTAVHPFVNGNGRTGKCILTLLNAGYDVQLLKDVLTSENFSNAVNASQFLAKAMEVLDPTGKLINEAYDEYMTHADNRKKIVELAIDMFVHDSDPNYRVAGMSALEFFKVVDMLGAMDQDLYERVFRGH